MGEESVQPFDSFNLIYKVLIWTGYSKLLNKPKNSWKRNGHQIYRLFSFFMTCIFMLQHFIFMVQKIGGWDRLDAESGESVEIVHIGSLTVDYDVREDTEHFENFLKRNNLEKVFDGLVIEIPQLYLFAKIVTLNLQTFRIDEINNLIRGPIFAANNKIDQKIIQKNNKHLSHLLKVTNIYVSLAAIFWPTSHFVKRYQDETAVVPSYVPFDTDTWGRYTLSVALEVIPLFWIGCGHIAFDCLVAAYFAQAQVQLKIMKNNLLHLFDTKRVNTKSVPFQYKDVTDPNLKQRLVYCVARFDKLAWYMKEVNEVFNPVLLFQFFTSSLSICVIIYRMSTIPVASVQFAFMMVILFFVSTQVFLYCYFGTLVLYESQSLVSSLYLSDWLSVSPHFRRQLLVVMPRWSLNFKPMISGVIPLSLSTFFSILKSAYSLYAILTARQDLSNTAMK